MEKKSDLLKQAIAEANAIKQAAIVNATEALKESFTPHLTKLFADKINEMEEEEEESKPLKETENIEEVENVEESEQVEESEEVSEEAEGEINLDELLAELNEDESADLTTEAKEKEGKEKEKKEDKKDDKKSEKSEKKSESKPKTPKADDDEDVDLKNMDEDELKKFVEDVIGELISSGELVGNSQTGPEAGPGTEDGMVPVGNEENEEEVNIDEILADLHEEEEVDEEETADTVMYESKVKSLEKELAEARKAIEVQSKTLNEINLFNSKLLYTNKIFKAKNLSESQKVKVLGSFDKAKTVKEAKLVYETLMTGLKETKKSLVKESIMGGASKIIGNTKAKQPIIETDKQVERMMKLAGLS